MEQIKVTYQTADGHISKAYIDSETFLGENKHTGEPLLLGWDENLDCMVDTPWYEVKLGGFELEIDQWGGWVPVFDEDRPVFGEDIIKHFLKFGVDLGAQPEVEVKPFVRVQPKRLSRRERKGKK